MTYKGIVLIMGGRGGIGTYLVEEFSRTGYQVLFTYYNNNDTAEKLERLYKAWGFKVDASNEENMMNFEKKILTEYGKVDAVIYGSGIFEDSLIENMTLESWNRVIATNLTGAFLCAKYMIQLLRNSGHGRFICIGSVMGESGIYGSCSYAASKAGIIGLVKSIALENARHGVTANVVSFGYIKTGMTTKLPEKVLESAMKKIPMKKTGEPSDAAKVVVDLCQEHTNYISGQVIRVNGLLYV